MNIDNIIKIIEGAVQQNLETVVLMLLVVASLYITNIVFGTLLGTFTEKFILKKFLFGILKGIVGCIGVFAYCYSLNLFALTLQSTKEITVSNDLVNTLMVIGVLVAWAWDIALDIYNKLKSFKELKFISYDDVHVQENVDNSQQEIG